MKVILRGRAEDVLAIVAVGKQEMEIALDVPEVKLLEIIRAATARGVEVRIPPEGAGGTKIEKPEYPTSQQTPETRAPPQTQEVPEVEPAEIFSEVEKTEELPVPVTVTSTPRKERVVSAKEGEDIAEVIGSRRRRKVID